MTKNKIAIAQINTKSGDLEYNAKLIIENIIEAQKNNVDLVIFPELALCGIGLKDAIKRHPIIAAQNQFWIEEIAKIATKICAIIGFINNDFENSVAIIKDGKITNIIKESNPTTIEIEGKNYYISLGNKKIKDIKTNGIDAIINICTKPTSIEKEYKLNKNLSKISKENSMPIIYVDLIGATDGLVFDGLSRVYNNGVLTAFAKPFEQDLLICDPFEESEAVNYSTSSFKQEIFSLNYDADLERTYKTLILGIKDYFKKTGFKRAVLGLSGGLDSTVCAVLLTDALGAENVLGISMPSKLTSKESKSDAQELAQNLGIRFIEAPIKEMVDVCDSNFQKLFGEIEKNWDYRYKQSFTMDNIQARSRAMFLWGVSNEFGNCLPIATSDKSESYMGYATINGDMSGGLAPIADITKTKLFALARWLNKNRKSKNAIPEAIILKKPGAELAIDPNTGKTLNAEDALMPYEFLDEIIWRIENKNENYNQMLQSVFLYEQTHQITKEQKTEWLDKFFRRMSTSFYKWSILPPAIVTDKHTINKMFYNQPITSSAINYKGQSQNEISEKIRCFL